MCFLPIQEPVSNKDVSMRDGVGSIFGKYLGEIDQKLNPAPPVVTLAARWALKNTVTAVTLALVIGRFRERIFGYADSHNSTITPCFVSTTSTPPRSIVGILERRYTSCLWKITTKAFSETQRIWYETVAPRHRLLICTLQITEGWSRPSDALQWESSGGEWKRKKESEVAVISRVRLPTITTVNKTWRQPMRKIELWGHNLALRSLSDERSTI